MICGNWYRLFSSDNGLVGVFLLSLFVAQLPQPTTPVSLLFSCISCNLLLPIKEYGEVHVEIRGSSHVCTGKCSDLYGEVHILRTGKFILDHRFPKPPFAKTYGEVHAKRFQTLLGECTGKFTNHPERLAYGEVHLKEDRPEGPYGEVHIS
jgi:hypothetical protein